MHRIRALQITVEILRLRLAAEHYIVGNLADRVARSIDPIDIQRGQIRQTDRDAGGKGEVSCPRWPTLVAKGGCSQGRDEGQSRQEVARPLWTDEPEQAEN